MDPFSNSRIYTLRPNPTFHEPWMSKEQKAENARISSGHRKHELTCMRKRKARRSKRKATY